MAVREVVVVVGAGFWGSGSQNWEAELGSHWSSRTMDGSLLAPLMNSSRDSLPARGTRFIIIEVVVFRSLNSDIF